MVPGAPAGARDRGQQRDARHDPDAPGAALPRARDRHRSGQSRLRRAGARVRRPRRARPAHRSISRTRFAARAGRRRSGADRAAHRSGGAHAGGVAGRDARARRRRPAADVPAAASELAQAVRARELRPGRGGRAGAARDRARTAICAPLITVCAEEALSRARNGVAGPLAGVPLLVKDVFDTAGVRTTAGSQIYADRVPSRSAAAVVRLEAAGAIMWPRRTATSSPGGSLVRTTSMATAATHGGPDGSRAAQAAATQPALAAGMTPLALGSDTGGSVRMPAACCGVVGMKPAAVCCRPPACSRCAPASIPPARWHERLPTARSPTPCWRAPPMAGDPAGLARRRAHRAAAAGAGFTDRPARRTCARRSWRAPEALGIQCVEVALPVPEADLWPVFYAEAAASHRDTFPARREEYGPTIRAKLDDAQRVAPGELAAAHRALAAWRAPGPDRARGRRVDLPDARANRDTSRRRGRTRGQGPVIGLCARVQLPRLAGDRDRRCPDRGAGVRCAVRRGAGVGAKLRAPGVILDSPGDYSLSGSTPR